MACYACEKGCCPQKDDALSIIEKMLATDVLVLATPENNAIRVTFKYAENGLKTSDGKAPGAFAIAGADKKFVWAQAKIDGKSVLVSSPSVKAPLYVRYAYTGFRGDCNLQNAEGLPAYPFRSDSVDYSQVK